MKKRSLARSVKQSLHIHRKCECVSRPSLSSVHPAFLLQKGRAALGQDRLTAVAIGFWRTATKKPDGLPKGSRLVGIYIGYGGSGRARAATIGAYLSARARSAKRN